MIDLQNQILRIYEDDFLMVIDKPSGLVVHSDQRTEEETLCGWVKENFPELENIGGVHMLDMGRTEKRWGIVNRLDREVSGCVLIAKTEEVFEELARQFREREVEKRYVAVVYGKILKDNGKEFGVGDIFEIDEPIGRHRKDPRRWAIGESSRNTKRDAKTICKILKITDKHSVLELQPITGRTHQLRLHVLSLGTSIVGDAKYFPDTEEFVKQKNEFDREIDVKRILLHAKSLQFVHPKTKEKIFVASELPAEFSQYLD